MKNADTFSLVVVPIFNITIAIITHCGHLKMSSKLMFPMSFFIKWLTPGVMNSVTEIVNGGLVLLLDE